MADPSSDGKADHRMDNWKVVFSRKVLREGFDTFHGYKGKLGPHQYSTRRLSTYFSMGIGHNGKEPKPGEVLDCLASDASSIENAGNFENWCEEFGYDTDSRKAERTYKECEQEAKELKAFLGLEAYEQLLWHTERD